MATENMGERESMTAVATAMATAMAAIMAAATAMANGSGNGSRQITLERSNVVVSRFGLVLF